VVAVQVDLGDDRFDVTYDPQRVGAEALLDVIRELGYAAMVVDRRPEAPGRGTTRVDVAALSGELGQLFAQARDANKPVLLRFSGPG